MVMLGEAIAQLARGCRCETKSAVTGGTAAALDARGVGAAAAAAAAVEEEQCAVCRMEFEGGEDVRVLPCAHVYHPPCIEQWLLLNKARRAAECAGYCLGVREA